MSRRRVVIGSDERGRPITAWEDAPELGVLPAHPPGPVERRYVTPEPVDSAREQRAAHARHGKDYIPTPEQRRQATENLRAIRNGHTKEPVMPAPEPASAAVVINIDLSPLEALAQVAREAHAAYEEKLVADEAWRLAPRALTAAWRDLPAELLDFSMIPGSSATDSAEPVAQPASEPPASIPADIPEERPAPTPHQARELTGRPATPALTKRQEHVLELLGKGLTRAEIAKDFGVAYQSIDGMLKSIGKKGLLPAEIIAVLPASFARYRQAAS